MDFQKVVDLRHSVRMYSKKAVPRKVIIELLKNGNKAPSSGNFQPWHFVVVTGKKRDLIAEAARRYLQNNFKKARIPKEFTKVALSFYENLGDAPVVILVYLENNLRYKRSMRLSIAAATQTIILSAVDKGLGTCWMGTLTSIRQSIHKILHIDKELVAGFILGYPHSDFTPLKRVKKPISEKVSFIR